MERITDPTLAQIEANYEQALAHQIDTHRSETAVLRDQVEHLKRTLEIWRSIYKTGNVTGILDAIANVETGVDRQDITVRETADGVSIIIANAEIAEGDTGRYPLGRIVARHAMYEVALVATADLGFTVKVAARDESSAHDEAVEAVSDALRNHDISVTAIANRGCSPAIAIDQPTMIEHSLETSYVDMVQEGVAGHVVGTYLVVHTT